MIVYHGTCHRWGPIIAREGLMSRPGKPPPRATLSKRRAFCYGCQSVAAVMARAGNFDGESAPPCWIITFDIDPARLVQDEPWPEDYTLPNGATADDVTGSETSPTAPYLWAPSVIRHHAGVIEWSRRIEYAKTWPDRSSVARD